MGRYLAVAQVVHVSHTTTLLTALPDIYHVWLWCVLTSCRTAFLTCSSGVVVGLCAKVPATFAVGAVESVLIRRGVRSLSIRKGMTGAQTHTAPRLHFTRL